MGKKKNAHRKAKRNAIYKKYGGRCAYCGNDISYKEMQIDHIIPRSRFNLFKKKVDYQMHDIRNLNPSCRQCNFYKRNFSIEEFRKEIEAQPERIRKKSGGFRLIERYDMLTVIRTKVVFLFETTEAYIDTKYILKGEDHVCEDTYIPNEEECS